MEIFSDEELLLIVMAEGKELADVASKFFEYFRMLENSFNLLLCKLQDHLKKHDTHWRKAVTAREVSQVV